MTEVSREQVPKALELVGLGHEVTLFASGDSETDARLVSVTREDFLEDMGRVT